MEEKKTPTFEEFYQAVHECFYQNSSLSKSEVDDYLKSVDSIREIRWKYDVSLKDYKEGKITYRKFMEGRVATVVNLLLLLW